MILHQIKNWSHFTELAIKWTKEGPNGPNIFRGQSDESWSLTPSLTRILDYEGLNYKKALDVENKILRKFQKTFCKTDDHCKTLKKNDTLAWWEVMQHYSIPTRLLDWSRSPYASLFFAVSGHPEKDGALYVMDAGYIQWIQSTRARDPDNKPCLNAFKELNESIRGNPYEKSMVTISAPFPTSRMKAQHSSFTLSTEIIESHDITGDKIVFGRCINKEEIDSSIFYKFIIPNNLKQEFLEKLKEINITQDALFPDSRIIEENSEKFIKEIKQIVSDV